MVSGEYEKAVEFETIHLRDYLRVIRERRFVVGLVFTLTMLLVIIVTARTVPVYEAATQVLVEKNSEFTGLVGQNVVMSYESDFDETQRQLILSYNVSRKVVDLLSLEKNWQSYFPEQNADQLSLVGTIKSWLLSLLPVSVTGNADASPIPKSSLSEADRIAVLLQENTKVRPVKNSRMINISFTSNLPDFSRLVANTLAKAYKEEIMAIQMGASSYALTWMTAKAEDQREILYRAEQALQAYMKQHDIVMIEDELAVLPQQVTDLTNRLAEAQAQKNVAESTFWQIETVQAGSGNLESLEVISNNEEVQEISAALRASEQQVNDLSKRYGPMHPRMKLARATLADTRRQLQSAIAKIVSTEKNKYDAAVLQEDSLRNSLEKIKGETLLMHAKLTEYTALKRDVDSIRELYNALMTNIKEKGITENTQKVNVWVTQPAKTPEYPIEPRKARNILIGLMVGLIGGICCAFFVDYLDNTVKDLEVAERRLGLPVIGVIEMLKKGKDPDTLSKLEPVSSFAESYKSMRTSVLLSSVDNPPKRLVITSMSPQEGKTTTVINLGRSVAQTDRRVLLIDADLRRPRLHKAFGLDNHSGLSSFLTGISETVSPQESGEPNLAVLTAGPIPPNPSEVVGSSRFSELLARLDEDFDMVIIDTPPVLSATDGLLISRLAEGVIVVCFVAKTTYDRLQHGIKSLREIDSPLLGLVLNSMDMKKSNYYSHYGYYQYYAAEKEE